MSAAPGLSPLNSGRFTERLLVRCPPSLPPAIDRAAAKNSITSSEYIRRSVIDRLKADGIDLSQYAIAVRWPSRSGPTAQLPARA
jgi:hypothetical protein